MTGLNQRFPESAVAGCVHRWQAPRESGVRGPAARGKCVPIPPPAASCMQAGEPARPEHLRADARAPTQRAPRRGRRRIRNPLFDPGKSRYRSAGHRSGRNRCIAMLSRARSSSSPRSKSAVTVLKTCLFGPSALDLTSRPRTPCQIPAMPPGGPSFFSVSTSRFDGSA